MQKIFFYSAVTALVFIFSSCIGMAIDIQMSRDGSGRVLFEYQMSHILAGLGALDGNQSMPPIPAGREDWQRTIQRIPGLRLVSYSSRETSQGTIMNVTLDYDNEKALSQLLDPSGQRISIKRDERSGEFDLLVFNEASSFDENMMLLAHSFLEGYDFSISFSAPSNSTMIINDSNNNAILNPASAVITEHGRKTSLKMSMQDVLALKNGLRIKFVW
ncbi:MAG: hypothetical protein FWD40_06185 [Treponema sp.]|nr:hypothetical protein [Treponema sp.]